MSCESGAQNRVHCSRAPLRVVKVVHSLGGRLKAWREAGRLKQEEAATQLGVPASTYQKYEMGIRAPGAEAMEAFVRAGINANWLLTGEGPMLLADLKPAPVPINRGALAALIQGAMEHYGANSPPEKVAAAAADFYERLINEGKITPTGIGEEKKAAA